MAYKYTKPNKHGFTIIELMIATLVFSVIMMLVMGTVIYIGKQYVKAHTQTVLEDSARNVFQDIATSIQTGSEPKPDLTTDTNWNAFCAGNTKYLYGKYDPSSGVTSYDTMKKGLYATSYDGTNCMAAAPGLTDQQLLTDNAKVLELSYNASSLSIVTSTSDADLLDFTSGVASDVRCSSSLAGREFCSIISFKGSAVVRVSGGP